MLQAAYFSETGCDQIQKGLSSMARSKLQQPLWFLAKPVLREHLGSVAMKSSIVRFVNTILTHTDDESRMSLHIQLKRIGSVGTVLSYLDACLPQHDKPHSVCSRFLDLCSKAVNQCTVILEGDEDGLMSVWNHWQKKTAKSIKRPAEAENPDLGNMTGTCVAAKHRGKATQAVLGTLGTCMSLCPCAASLRCCWTKFLFCCPRLRACLLAWCAPWCHGCREQKHEAPTLRPEGK